MFSSLRVTNQSRNTVNYFFSQLFPIGKAVSMQVYAKKGEIIVCFYDFEAGS